MKRRIYNSERTAFEIVYNDLTDLEIKIANLKAIVKDVVEGHKDDE